MPASSAANISAVGLLWPKMKSTPWRTSAPAITSETLLVITHSPSLGGGSPDMVLIAFPRPTLLHPLTRVVARKAIEPC